MNAQPTQPGLHQASAVPKHCLLQARRITDMKSVRDFITHQQVYRHVVDDASPARDLFQPAPAHGDSVLYVLVEEERDGGAAGIFAFYQQNSVTTEAHTCVHPALWGRTEEAARTAIAWVFSNTAFLRIVSCVPDDNPLAARLAVKAGMTQYGYNPNSFLRNGNLLGMDLYGISKEAICQ